MTSIGIPLDPCIPGESWRDIVGHEGDYSISSAGRLWSHRGAGRLLHPAHGRRVVLAGGRVADIGELVLEAHEGQARPEPGAIAWAEDKDVPYPYRLENLQWITRAELLAILRAARSPRPRPQAEVIELESASHG